MKNPMINFKKASFLLLSICSLFSCSKDSEPVKIIETPTTNPPTTPVVDADYVLTAEFRGSKTAIILWKDGVSRDISDGTYDEIPIDLEVSGNDVYILAEVNFTATSKIIRVYKNGTPTDITVPSATTNPRALDVVGNDVYIAGESYNATTNNTTLSYWKNGAKTDLLSNVFFSTLNDIKVVANSVYVLGSIRNANSNSEVTYWKDGAKTTIVNPVGFNSEATSFDIVGTTVHITGYKSDTNVSNSKRPFYWNNTTETALLTNTTPAVDEFANHISVSNGIVYIVGEANTTGGFRASLWKGAVQTIIEPTATLPNFAKKVQVNGTVVYVGGRQKFASNIEKATVWKAGVATRYVTTAATSSSLVDMHFKP